MVAPTASSWVTTCCGLPSMRPRPKLDRKSTRLNSSHLGISYAVFCLKKKRITREQELVLAQGQQHGKSGAPATGPAPAPGSVAEHAAVLGTRSPGRPRAGRSREYRLA